MKISARWLLLPVIVFIVTLLLPYTVFAAANSSDVEKIVNLGKDQTVNSDYFAAGSRVTIDGTINGDAYVAGGQIDVNGTINGDLLVAGGQITIRGKVSQNVRGAGGNISVTGDIGRNITLAGGNLIIDKTSKIAGNAVLAGGNIDVLSQVRDLSAGGGNLRISGPVLGNVKAGIGMLDVQDGADIRGNLEYWSQNKVNMAQAARISGNTTFHQLQTPEELNAARTQARGLVTGARFFFTALSFLTSLVLGLVIFRIFPVFSQKTAETVTGKFWQSMITGFIALVVIPVAAIILMITVVGIPLGFLVFFGYGLVTYFAKLFVALAVGNFIGMKTDRKFTIAWAFVAGLLIYYILSLIPVVGFLVKLIFLLTGTGAIVLQKKYYYESLREKKMI